MLHSSDKKTAFVSLLKNTLALCTTKIFMPLSYFLITVAIGRILGIKEFGIFSILITYYGIFRMLASLGIDQWLLREIAHIPEQGPCILWNAVLTGIVSSLINMILLPLVFFIVGYSGDICIYGMVFSLMLLPDIVARYIESFFTAQHKSGLISFSALVRECVKIGLALVALCVYKSFMLVIAAIVLSYYVWVGLNLILVRRLIGTHIPSFSFPMICSLVRSSLVLACITLISSLFLAMDVIILSKIKGEVAVGIYTAAYKFLTLAFLGIDSFNTALVPLLTRLFTTQQETFQKIIALIARYFIAGLFLYAITLSFFAQPLIIGIYGPLFSQAIGVLFILVWVTVLLGISYLFARILFVGHLQRYDLISLATATIVSPLFMIPFTKKWGYQGTAIALLCTMMLLTFLHGYFVHRKIISFSFTEWILKPACAGIGFFVIGSLTRTIPFYGGIFLGLGVYVLLLVLFGVVKKQEIQVLRNILFLKN